MPDPDPRFIPGPSPRVGSWPWPWQQSGAIGRRFELALAWLTAGTLLGLLVPLLGVAVIAAFNVFYWFPIRGESPPAQPSSRPPADGA